jgi:hypothetical protein
VLFYGLLFEGMNFGSARVGELVNASRNDPFGTCYESGTLEQVAEEMLAKKLHRIVVLTEKHFLHSIVSLSDILLFLAEHVLEWRFSCFSFPFLFCFDIHLLIEYSPLSVQLWVGSVFLSSSIWVCVRSPCRILPARSPGFF